MAHGQTLYRHKQERPEFQPYRGENYYGLPAVKATHYGWLIIFYFFIGGIASGVQFLSTIADLVGGKPERPLVRAGRYLALIGAMISPLLLIGDLLYKRRWYNMLRIYRGTSAMSIGSWALITFGAFSGLTAVGQALDDFGFEFGSAVARVCQLPAAMAGAVVALYTGTLMAATNMPLSAKAFPYLSSLFASSAASTAAATLSLVAEGAKVDEGTRQRLNLFAVFAGTAELLFAVLIDRQWRESRTTKPVRQIETGLAYRGGVLGMGIGLPLAIHTAELVTRRDSRPVSTMAAIAMLIGGFILRAVFVLGARKSAESPEAYFDFTNSQAPVKGNGNGRK